MELLTGINEWIDSLSGTTEGTFWATFLMSMLPVAELRLGLPYGIAKGLSVPMAWLASIAGNMLPVPFLILFTRPVFRWMRTHIPALGGLVDRLERKAESHREAVLKYKFWGLMILVAIPLPGTGAWTGALVATVMDLRMKSALPSIFLGVVGAAAIVTLLTLGIIAL